MTVPRILPALTATTRAYWTGGADGALLIERCADCRRWQHPPTGTCGDCGADAAPEPVSGRGEVLTFPVAPHQYPPDVPTPSRSEERRGGKGGARPCRSRGAPAH